MGTLFEVCWEDHHQRDGPKLKASVTDAELWSSWVHEGPRAVGSDPQRESHVSMLASAGSTPAQLGRKRGVKRESRRVCQACRLISRVQPGLYKAVSPLASSPFSSSSECSGFTLTSEDSSEVAFLLVENYNYDRSCWPSGRQGIFEPLPILRHCSWPAATLKKRAVISCSAGEDLPWRGLAWPAYGRVRSDATASTRPEQRAGRVSPVRCHVAWCFSSVAGPTQRPTTIGRESQIRNDAPAATMSLDSCWILPKGRLSLACRCFFSSRVPNASTRRLRRLRRVRAHCLRRSAFPLKQSPGRNCRMLTSRRVALLSQAANCQHRHEQQNRETEGKERVSQAGRHSRWPTGLTCCCTPCAPTTRLQSPRHPVSIRRRDYDSWGEARHSMAYTRVETMPTNAWAHDKAWMGSAPPRSTSMPRPTPSSATPLYINVSIVRFTDPLPKAGLAHRVAHNFFPPAPALEKSLLRRMITGCADPSPCAWSARLSPALYWGT
ncbi:hypothetical protein BS50DRAFT_590601 [Corynespora cassiicola Philippines]|uniref:Uncharacterized protein n=1 Tax=Corynespora cassiicola Philippines TaxID=1448308 RepID=A0A2T2NDP9_CORCC|nr:hypothetical protein BS50DRAFT_590601 [Corynespora cassiicola Philippines]